jgi:hypothetical protein
MLTHEAMRYDRRIIGYHACTVSVAEQLLAARESFRPSHNPWDWLGHGVYFWEYGYQRAFDWARESPRLRGEGVAIVGAIIQLGRCLDLLDTDHTTRLAAFAAEYQRLVGALPINQGTRRDGDCMLINQFCERMAQESAGFDTVRGLFQEGPPVAPGSGISLKNHIQVVVREPQAIVGLFRPREFSAWSSP